jgi:hypothetical protein
MLPERHQRPESTARSVVESIVSMYLSVRVPSMHPRPHLCRQNNCCIPKGCTPQWQLCEVFKAASNFTLLNWNVCGLNAPVKRSVVRDMIKAVHATVVCIQETKLSQLDARTVAEMLGPQFQASFSFLPSVGSSGGILFAVSDDYFKLISSPHTRHTHTVKIQWLATSATRAKPANVRLATRILLYSWWNVWKERNMRIFESTQCLEFHVADAVKEDAEMFLRAMREFRPPLFPAGAPFAYPS